MAWQIDPDVVWTESDEEVRLYNAASGEFETLNATGAAIWLLLAEGVGTAEAVERLVVTYGAGDAAQRALVETDVTRFVAELERRGLLHAVAGTDSVDA